MILSDKRLCLRFELFNDVINMVIWTGTRLHVRLQSKGGGTVDNTHLRCVKQRGTLAHDNKLWYLALNVHHLVFGRIPYNSQEIIIRRFVILVLFMIKWIAVYVLSNTTI